MDVVSLALRTDLAVAALDGTVDDRGDHVAVATPDQPHFYWGNYLVIAPPPTPASATAWLTRAAAARCAGAAHVALAIDAPDGALDPAVTAALVAAGATVETMIAMTCDQPLTAPAPAGVELRRFDRPSDWDALFALSITIDPDTPAMRAFLTQRIAARARAAARGEVRWWGAFADGALVASAGVVPLRLADARLADCARYQDVQTHAAWRRRGVASAVLAAIAREVRGGRAAAPDRPAGARLVLVVGEDNAAARAAYQRLGFVERDRAVMVLVAPPQS
ncbi:MAG: GNAT family N-acetyltransferase [Myxococcales bacterium]|nr:GNAT family N-acetyltransferase [Myxococcales bacterium]